MMSFQELDAYLNQEFSGDYWYDDAKLYAHYLVERFTTEDWEALRSSWRSRSKPWQIRCAEVIDWGEARQVFPILIELILQENDELTLAAADSLRSINIVGLDFSISKDVLERLQAVAETGNIARMIVDEVQKIGLN